MICNSHSQLEEVKEDYPEWAQFIGSCIVLTSALAVPTFLIVRLIAYQSARDQALEVLLRISNSCKEFYYTVVG